ncbi:hypothetical protein Pfo_006962 [Paulownia fortunei]|nr:hypothetical protein Pfo_006962 [Paulownia fortunei]
MEERFCGAAYFIMLQQQRNECYQVDCREESNDQKTRKLNITQAKQRKKLGSILNFEKHERFYDDYPQVLKNAEKSKGFHQKKQVERKLDKSEELVKYMSYLPSYLERGENPQDKPFNIGVLDWRLLEKWQHCHNDVSGINVKHPPSTSNTSSFISSEVSSSHSSRDNTWSFHQQRINHPSLPSHLNATPTEECSSGTKLLAGNEGKFLGCKNGSIDLLKVQQSLLQATQTSSLDTANRLMDSKNKESDLQRVPGSRSQHFETDGIVSGLKGNDRIHKGEALKAEGQVPSYAVSDRDFSERCKTAVAESTDDPGNSCFSTSHQSDSSKGDNHILLKANWYSFYRGSNAKFCNTKFRSGYTNLHYLPNESGKTKDSQVEQSCSEEVRILNCPSGKEQRMLFTGSVSISPSRRKNLEKKNSGSKPGNLAENEVFQVKVGISESTKVRNPSPTRRLSFGVGRIGKSSSSNSSAIPLSENIPDSKVTSNSACSSDSTSEKSNATSRARSSPLRRLLDPLLKPEVDDSHHFARSSERNLLTTDRTVKSSRGQRESPALHSGKVTLDLKGCRTVDIGGPHQTRNNGTSTMQALLQVALKNGLPLFTFTVDNCSDILAATVKEICSENSAHRWIYTFFSFSEMKKKNVHWINQGSKDRNDGYISNIVAQMKVSDILYTNSNGKRSVSKSWVREFVLSSVGARDVDQTSDSLSGDELAAIVVKFPERIGGQCNQDGQQRGIFNKSATGLKQPFQQVRNCSNSRDDEGNESASDALFSATVILPGGNHGVPSKGEPSPLIERWKSGGSCDCGGWDLGCRIRVLANCNQLSQRFISTKSQLTAFKLFSQEEVEENRPMFILSPFEDGVFSVECNSSLKLVQAFSVGIAVLNSRTSAILSSNMFGDKISQQFTLSENSVSKIFNPPLSPVGRV